MKKNILPMLVVILTLSMGSAVAYKIWHKQTFDRLAAPVAISLEEWEKKDGVQTLPSELNLAMSFYTQAPFSNWDYPWQEACEEASIALVANAYLKTNWSREAFNNELLKLVDWENSTYGDYKHTSVEQTAKMLQSNYGLNSITHKNPSFADIKTILNKGHFIVAPFAGKLLNNPNFRNGGPIYHMLVIKGYNTASNQIVTNDVGTRNGENYVYPWDIIQVALHDWHDTDITQGEKIILEILPPTS